MLGYANHSSFILEQRMAKSLDNVQTFLDRLRTKLIPFAQKERQALLELKRQEKEAAGEAFDGELHSHDFRYTAVSE